MDDSCSRHLYGEHEQFIYYCPHPKIRNSDESVKTQYINQNIQKFKVINHLDVSMKPKICESTGNYNVIEQDASFITPKSSAKGELRTNKLSECISIFYGKESK